MSQSFSFFKKWLKFCCGDINDLCVLSILCPEGREGMQLSKYSHICFWTGFLCQVSVPSHHSVHLIYCMPVKQLMNLCYSGFSLSHSQTLHLVLHFPQILLPSRGRPHLPEHSRIGRGEKKLLEIIWMLAGKASIAIRKAFILPSSQWGDSSSSVGLVKVKGVKTAHTLAVCGLSNWRLAQWVFLCLLQNLLAHKCLPTQE